MSNSPSPLWRSMLVWQVLSARTHHHLWNRFSRASPSSTGLRDQENASARSAGIPNGSPKPVILQLAESCRCTHPGALVAVTPRSRHHVVQHGVQRNMVTVPFIDMTKLVVKFARSSGPGGQHVNKTESKVDMRIRLDDIHLPPDAMGRLQDAEGGRINKLNELVITSDENRERQRNHETCLKKLSEILTLASIPPKVRNTNSKTAGKFNAKRLEEKSMQSRKKTERRQSRDFE